MQRAICLVLVLLAPALLAGCTREDAGVVVGALLGPDRVDLTGNQTAGFPAGDGVATPSVIRNQGPRGTCITFAAIAALEAAYKRAGYGNLDLSEEFLNHFGKMNWLHYRWDDFADKPAGWKESQVGLFSGGGGLGYLLDMESGYAVPNESVMPYSTRSPYDLADYPPEMRDSSNAYWRTSQWNASSWNLNRSILRDQALAAPAYYSVADVTTLCGNERDGWRPCSRLTPEMVEVALRQGHEVVWDAFVGAADTTGPVWTLRDASNRTGAHSMLIVGYDRTAQDEPYFIVKNSWGPVGGGANGDCGENGFTCVDYDLLRATISAGHVTAVEPPRDRPELAFLGRWDVDLDGERGTLDVYHLPGSFQHVFDAARARGDIATREWDSRVGTFYDAGGNAYRVNGEITGNLLKFWIDRENPNLRWHETTGRWHELRVMDDDQTLMAGDFASDEGIRPAYARKGGLIDPPAHDSARSLTPASYVGDWDVFLDGREARLVLVERDDSLLSWFPGRDHPYAALRGFYRESGTFAWMDVVAAVDLGSPEDVQLLVFDDAHGAWALTGRHFAREGRVAGSALVPPATAADGRFTDARVPFLATRATPTGVVAGSGPSVVVHAPPRYAEVSRGVPVGLRAFAWDREDAALPVTWRESGGGTIAGRGNVTHAFLEYGHVRIEAVAWDSAGQEGWRDVPVTVVNDPPSVSILGFPNGTLHDAYAPITLEAVATDVNEVETDGRLASSGFTWVVANESYAGRVVTVRLPPGTHEARVTATDPRGATDNATITIHVGAAPAPAPAPSAPVVAVDAPADGARFTADASDSSGWYRTVHLDGAVTDADGDVARVWWTDTVNGVTSEIAEGADAYVRLHAGECDQSEFGTRVHELTLWAEDAGGRRVSASVTVTVETLC